MWAKIAQAALMNVFESVSPHLREFVQEAVLELEEKAKATDNKWDDFLVLILKALVGLGETENT